MGRRCQPWVFSAGQLFELLDSFEELEESLTIEAHYSQVCYGDGIDQHSFVIDYCKPMKLHIRHLIERVDSNLVLSIIS